MRGLAEVDLTPDLAMKLAQAAARVSEQGRTFLVARDTRISGYLLEQAVIAGLCAEGVEVMAGGVMPTPAVAYLIRSLKLDGGLMVSASHNTYEYNGLKFFGPGGDKLEEKAEAEIEALLEAGLEQSAERHIGAVSSLNGLVNNYVSELSAPLEGVLRGLKLVVDCAHGSLFELAPNALSEMGADIATINCAPNGYNINEGGAVRPQQLAAAVRECGADAGLAFDGDGDRLALVDENGNLVDGDQSLAILASDMLSRGELGNPVVVGTWISNGGLEKLLYSLGCRFVRSAVGDRFVTVEMQRVGAILGGETCGHLIFSRHLSSADGLYAGSRVLGVMARTGKRLSELAAVMEKHPQYSRNVKVPGSRAWENDEAIRAAVEDARRGLGGEGWIVVRASGTEPLIRVTVECKEEKKAQKIVDDIAQIIVERLVNREAFVDVAA